MVFKFWANTDVKQSKKLKKTQEKAIRIINLKDRTKATNPPVTKIKIMKMKNILILHSKIFCLFICDQINEKSPNTFAECFIIASNQHSYNTRGSKYKTIIKTISNSTIYSINAIEHRTAWKEVTK